jgi:hypothetical protein
MYDIFDGMTKTVTAHNVQTARHLAQALANEVGYTVRYRDNGTGRFYSVHPQ